MTPCNKQRKEKTMTEQETTYPVIEKIGDDYYYFARQDSLGVLMTRESVKRHRRWGTKIIK